jgi:hypothetical protein
MPPETLDSLDKDSLKPLVLQLLSRIDTLVERNSELAEQIKTLLARIAELEARAGQPPKTPANSSLPPIKPVTTRINLHKGQCPCCKTRVAAKPPAAMMPGSPFGPGIVSLVTYLHACQMVSYARMTEVLGGLFGVKLSEGAIANMLARAEKPFAPAPTKSRGSYATATSSPATRPPRASSEKPTGSGRSSRRQPSITRSRRRAARPCRPRSSGKPSRRCGCRIGLRRRESTRPRISIASRT